MIGGIGGGGGGGGAAIITLREKWIDSEVVQGSFGREASLALPQEQLILA